MIYNDGCKNAIRHEDGLFEEPLDVAYLPDDGRTVEVRTVLFEQIVALIQAFIRVRRVLDMDGSTRGAR